MALSIVLERDEDLARINRLHPDHREHKYYGADAKFPADISDLLLPSADRWWEILGKFIC